MHTFITLMLFVVTLLISFEGQTQIGSYGNWLNREIAKTKKEETHPKHLEVKLKFLQQAKNLEIHKNFVSEMRDDFIYTEIVDLFHGSYKKASDVYWKITLGKHPKSLFLESGAGAFEKITDVKQVPGGMECIVDRIYKSKLAFNSQSKIRLRRFHVPEKEIMVVVNELVQDFGAELQAKYIENQSKPYGPILYDTSIDIYRQIDEKHFLFSSFSLFRGQGLKSTSTALNAAKKLFASKKLEQKIETKIADEAKNIWEKRKEVFQQLIEKL